LLQLNGEDFTACAASAFLYTVPLLIASVVSIILCWRQRAYQSESKQQLPSQQDIFSRIGCRRLAAPEWRCASYIPVRWPPLAESPWPLPPREMIRYPWQFAVFSAGLLLAFGAMRFFGSQYCVLVCMPVERQAPVAHFADACDLLARGALVFWLSASPLQAYGNTGLSLLALAEFAVSLLFWEHCEKHMMNSVQTGASFGAFDMYILGVLTFSTTSMVLSGLPTLRVRGRFAYLGFFGVMILLHVAMFCLGGFHMHHYHTGFIFGMICSFTTPISSLSLLKVLFLLIQGIAVWGADSVIPDYNTTFWSGVIVFLEDILARAVFACALVAWAVILGRKRYQEASRRTHPVGASVVAGSPTAPDLGDSTAIACASPTEGPSFEMPEDAEEETNREYVITVVGSSSEFGQGDRFGIDKFSRL